MNGLAAARAATERNPTKEQIEAGNYAHGKVQVHGFTVSLENPKGGVRRGVGRNGMMWETKMTADYGRILNTEGADDEHLDVFIGPDHDSELVYVIDQVHPDSGRFDEHKVILGTDSEAEARALYLSNYTSGWKGLGEITSLTLDEFKGWVEHHDTSKPIAPKKRTARDVFKSVWDMIVKGNPIQSRAQQFGLFGPAEDVKEPGKRGGRYYRTKTGHVRYGEKPRPLSRRYKTLLAQSGVHEEQPISRASKMMRALREAREAHVPAQASPEDEYRQLGVLAPRFRAWFGKSKVIDEHGDPKETYNMPNVGKPLVVFHGSPQKFSAFDPQKANPGLYGKGFYFTEDRIIAEGEWEEVDERTYFPTKEAAEAVPNRTHWVWSEDLTAPAEAYPEGKRWIAVTKKRQLKRPGYAGNPESIELTPEIRTKLGEALENHIKQRGVWEERSGYWSDDERKRVKGWVSQLKAGAEPVDGWQFKTLADATNLLSDQPYNLPVSRLAEEVGVKMTGNVYACYLSIQDPFIIDEPDPNGGGGVEPHLYEGEEWNKVHDRIANTARRWVRHGDVWLTTAGSETYSELSKMLLPHLRTARMAGEDLYQTLAGTVGKEWVNEFLADAGFDGVTHMGGQISHRKNHRVWIAFSPTQAKAVENDGTFDPSNPDLFKAQQLGLFDPRPEPQQPGIRGGKYYRTETGHVRYGEKPAPEVALRQSIEEAFEPKPGEAVDPLGMVRLKPVVPQFVVSPSGIVASLNEAERAQLPQETGADALIPHVGREVLGLKSEEQIATERAEEPDPKTAEKLRGLADAMTEQVEQHQNPAVSHQNITARRANIAANMAQHGDWLADVQAILYGLADLHENGKIPVSLKDVKSRALVEDLLRRPPDAGHPNQSDYYAGKLKSRFPYPAVDRHELRALEERIKGKRLPADVRRLWDGVVNRGENEFGRTRLYGVEELNAVKHVAKQLVGLKNEYGHVDDFYPKSVLSQLRDSDRALHAGLDNEEKWDAAALAVRDFRKVTDKSATRRIQEMERALIGRKIPGYFPTPTVTVEHLLELADIQPGQTILEPSAGKGNIADVIHARYPDNVLFVNEVNTDLSAVLEAKGYKDQGYLNELRAGSAVASAAAGARFQADFLSLFPVGMPHRRIDCIVMNPPFEDGQDVEHVKHAYDVLAPGGRLVSVMGEHSFFATDKRSQEFRSWLATHGREEKLPAGSFLSSERSTGVAARVVVIDKPTDSSIVDVAVA